MHLQNIQSIHRQYDHVYVSPHLDDVAASCSGRILKQVDNGESVLIVTVFTETPVHGPTLSSNDLKPILNYKRRRGEDTRAMQRMGVDYLWLEHPEFLFRNKRPWVRFPTGQPDDRRKAHQDRPIHIREHSGHAQRGLWGALLDDTQPEPLKNPAVTRQAGFPLCSDKSRGMRSLLCLMKYPL